MTPALNEMWVRGPEPAAHSAHSGFLSCSSAAPEQQQQPIKETNNLLRHKEPDGEQSSEGDKLITAV